jgi:hypothetical protein
MLIKNLWKACRKLFFTLKNYILFYFYYTVGKRFRRETFYYELFVDFFDGFEIW